MTHSLDKFATNSLQMAENDDALYVLLTNIVARLDRLETLVVEQLLDATTTIVSENVTVHRLADGNTVTGHTAYDLASAISLLNSVTTAYTAHIADTTTHANADAVNTVAAAAASDLATSLTLANELKGDMNAHRSQATIHDNNDAGNIVAAANATNLATLLVLVNELATDFNGHIALIQGIDTDDDINESILV